MHELFAPHAPHAPDAPQGESDVSSGWILHGVTATGQPVITRRASRSAIQVLEPGDRFVTFELPGQQDDPDVAGYLAEPVGASTTRVAVQTRDLEDPGEVATHVLDRPSDTVVTVHGVDGLALVEDLLLAVEVDAQADPTAVVGIDAADGARLWTLDADAGHQLWEADRIGRLWTATPSRLDRDQLVVATTLAVEALSLRDGTPAWAHASDVELAADHLVLGARHAVVAATDGEVVALDRDDGTVAWRTELGVPVAAMTGAGDHVLVGTADGLVVHLDGTGREVQRIAIGTDPVLGLAALGETVVAVVGDAVVGLRADGSGVSPEDEVPLPGADAP